MPPMLTSPRSLVAELQSRGVADARADATTRAVYSSDASLNRVLELDAETRTAIVEPGAVHATLQKAALAQGLRFGPDPSTHTRCTVGGMIGNNACGSRALGYGRTVDNVERLKVALADGTTASLGDGAPVPASDTLD